MERFINRLALVFSAITLAVFISGCSTPQPPANLGLLKNDIKTYYADGDYEKNCKIVGKKALKQLKAWEGKKKTAIVLDIDDTSVCTYQQQILPSDFGYNPKTWNEWANKADAPAIKPTLQLAEQALEQGTAIFFITGRRENLRECTEKNLHNAGYKQWTSLIMKPTDYHGDAVSYKTSERKKIVTDMGYTIILNMGDQESDLDGGYAETTFKLPNPCYYIP